MSEHFYVGVDVGTSSVRAALIGQNGEVVTMATHPIDIFEPQPDFYEQSSDNIWNGCCAVVKSVCSGVNKAQIRGLGFDATCSLVVLDKECRPLSVSHTGRNCWNVMMWMDHRAADQAKRINKTNHPVLKCVGGSMSLEMESPKLLWIKENLECCWDNAAHFFDLPDFLTWKATGSLSRSLCSAVCKWTYKADRDGNNGWDNSYFTQIGLQELVQDGYSKIGNDVLCPGSLCGSGVTQMAAVDLGLLPGTPVATSIIDAYAGTLGCLGCVPDKDDLDICDLALTSKLALICGTSTCHLAISDKPVLVPGVWGPFYSVLVPGFWLHEGGQSAAGKLLDHIVQSHPAYSWVKDEAEKRGCHIYDVLQEILEYKAKRDGATSISHLTHDVHVWPDYHGNRSPLADPTLRGMLCGLSLSDGAENLAVQYLATVQALAYSTRHIMGSMAAASYDLRVMYACGGLAKCQLYIQTHADVTGIPVILPDTTETVLLGAAMLGATASGDYNNIQDAMLGMGGHGRVIKPEAAVKQFHAKKFEVFQKMVKHQREYSEIMNT